MESEEQQVGSQDGDNVEEGAINRDTPMERSSREVIKELNEHAPTFHPQEAEGLVGADQDIAESLLEAAQRVVAEVTRGAMELSSVWGVPEQNQGKAEELEKVAGGHFKNVEVESKTEMLDGVRQENMHAFVSLDQSDGISLNQADTGTSVQMNEKQLAEEGEIILEMGKKKAEELTRPDHREAEELVKLDGADSKKSTNDDQHKVFIGLDEREVKELTGSVEVVFTTKEVEEVLGPDQNKPEGMTGEVVESAVNQGDIESLTGLSERDSQKITGWEENVEPAGDQEKTEVMPRTEQEIENVTLIEDVTTAEGQSDTGDLVRPVQEEISVLAGEELGLSTLYKGEAVVLGPGQEGPQEVGERGKEDMAPTLGQPVAEEIDQGERVKSVAIIDSLLGGIDGEAEEKQRDDVAPAGDEEAAEEVPGAPQEGVEIITVRNVVLVRGIDEEAEERQREDVTPAGDEKAAEEVPGAPQEGVEMITVRNVALVRGTDEEAEEKQREDVTPAGDERAAEEVPVAPQEGVEKMIAERNVALAVGEDFLEAKQGEVEEVTGEKDVIATMDKGEAGGVPEAEETEGVSAEGDVATGMGQRGAGDLWAHQRETGEITGKKDVLPTADLSKAETMEMGRPENLLKASQGEADWESVVPVLEYGEDLPEAEKVSTEGEAAPVVGEGLLACPGESAGVADKEEMAPAVGQAIAVEEAGWVSKERETESTVSQREAGVVEMQGTSEMRPEEIPEQHQIMEAKVEEVKSVMDEKVRDLRRGEWGQTEELIVSEKETRDALDLEKSKEGMRPEQEERLEVAGVDKEALSGYPGDAEERIVLAQELFLGPELETKLAEQEMVREDTGEGITGLPQERAEMAKPCIDEAARLARVSWTAADTGLHQEKEDSELLQPGLRVPEVVGKSTSVISHLSETTVTRRPSQCHRRPGKKIVGLAGLRQGSGTIVHHGMTRSAGVVHGVLEHRAPGLIITSLTAQAQAEQDRLTKQGRKQLETGTVEKRVTRSAEQVQVGFGGSVGGGIVLIGHRTGREGIPGFSEMRFKAEDSLQVPVFEETGRMSDQKQEDVLMQQTSELGMLKKNINDLAGRTLEEGQLPQLDRLLAQSYERPRPRSACTARVGQHDGLSLRPLWAERKGQSGLSVVGQGNTSKSAGHTAEPSRHGSGSKVLELSSRSADVHWIREVLPQEPTPSPLSVAGHGSTAEESPNLTAERQSPGLLRGKQELKDWRNGVMGIAIKKYKAVRLAMWGEGPSGLQVKGIKVSGCVEDVQDSVILEQIEKRRLKLLHHMNGNVPAAEGKSVNDMLAQGVGLRGS